MAKTAPSSVEIRSYQVGFGDCFLVSFVYGPRDHRHVLIDFGTTGLTPKAKAGGRAAARRRVAAPKPSDHLPKVAEAIRAHCAATTRDGRLTAVVATHRHADHISGFATDGASGGAGTIIAKLRPRLVIQPWTEDPAAAKNASTGGRTPTGRSAKGMVAGLAAMGDLARSIAALAAGRAGRGLSASARRQLAFLGTDAIPNASAVANLRAMGKAGDVPPEYARYGDDTALARLLPGVSVRVLGPPDLTQTKKIKTQRSRDPDEFWQRLAASPALALGGVAGAAPGRAKGRGAPLPPEARWFRARLDGLREQSLLQIVRQLDDAMNNTSLILLFDVAGRKKLLFPGDAQIENWSYALRDAPGAAANRALLADVDVYKVGHHGSLNATPKALLWEQFRKLRSKGGKMTSLLSTMHGKHGDTRRKTEVPRKPLLDALAGETTLHNTETYGAGRLLGVHEDPVVVPL